LLLQERERERRGEAERENSSVSFRKICAFFTCR
jgi:hypothetical protein